MPQIHFSNADRNEIAQTDGDKHRPGEHPEKTYRKPESGLRYVSRGNSTKGIFRYSNFAKSYGAFTSPRIAPGISHTVTSEVAFSGKSASKPTNCFPGFGEL